MFGMTERETRIPSLNSLRFFEVAARHMSFTKAANELHVTQSAVSHRIKTLEEELGFRLFKRESSNLILTEEGEQMLPELSRIFNQLNSLISNLRQNVKRKPLHIVLRPYFAQSWLLPRLPDFWSSHPDIDLHLEHSIHMPDFDAEGIDLGIQWAQAPNADFESTLLVDGGLTAFCSVNMPNKPQSVEELCEHLLLDEENPQNWNDWLQLAGLNPTRFTRRLGIDDTNVRVQAAIDGAGIVLTCPTLLQQNRHLHRLVALFPEIVLKKYNYYLTYPKGANITEQGRVFIDWIKKQVTLSSPDL